MRSPKDWILASMLLLGVATALPSAAIAADEASLLQLDDDHAISLEAHQVAGLRCGTIDSGPADLPRAPGKERPMTLDATIEIPVAFHVIYTETVSSTGTVTRKGDVSRSRIESQISVLNTSFATAGIRFTLRSIDRRKSSKWFAMTMGSTAEGEAKAALAIDPAHVLNIYSAAPSNGVLGWAYFPWSFPEANTMHGLVVLHSTMPGGSAKPYHLGDTAVHEIGHAFGLYHTFEGGYCRVPGDYVSDTPEEARPAFACPTGIDTCPSPGRDPIENFMDYSDDACMRLFTPGQMTRMRWALDAYKRSLPALTPTALPREGAAPAIVRFVNVRPNPFNPTATIAFRLERAAHVSLRVYDVAGRDVAQLANRDFGAGEHSLSFEGRGLASGVYMAVLRADHETIQERLVLAK